MIFLSEVTPPHLVGSVSDLLIIMLWKAGLGPLDRLVNIFTVALGMVGFFLH